MHFFFEATEVAKTAWDTWAPVVTQVLATAGLIFGGAEYWKWKQMKLQTKRDEQSKESGLEKKVDTLTETVKALDIKVDGISDDMQEVKKDVALLEEANEATVKYRELRDKQDKDSAVVQRAIIKSLTGILRERLLENYHRCVAKGFYSKEEREVYGAMFECYTQDPFNGNGVMHQLQPIMQKLPWTEDEAKK